MPPASVTRALLSQQCTACNDVTIKNLADAKLHPLLGCIVCRKCYHTYGNGNFSELWDDGVDEYGDDNYCRWCCDGGDLFGCMRDGDETKDRCHFSFCRECIERNVPNDPILTHDSESSTFRWHCYRCDPSKLTKLRKESLKFINNLKNKEDSLNQAKKQVKSSIPQSTVSNLAAQALQPPVSTTKAPTNQRLSTQAPASKPSSNQTPPNQTPSKQASSNQTPSSQKTTNLTPSNQKTTNLTPSNQKPTNQTPSNQKPTNQTPSNQKPTNQLPSTQKPANLTPSTQKPTNQLPSTQKPANLTPSKQAPPGLTPATHKPPGLTPADQKPAGPPTSATTNQTSSNNKPSNQGPVVKTSAQTKSVKQLTSSSVQIEKPQKPKSVSHVTMDELRRRLCVYRKTKDLCVQELHCKFDNIVDMLDTSASKKLINIELESIRKPLQDFEIMLRDLQQQSNRLM